MIERELFVPLALSRSRNTLSSRHSRPILRISLCQAQADLQGIGPIVFLCSRPTRIVTKIRDMNKALVAGALGVTGRTLINYLVSLGHWEVIGLSRGVQNFARPLSLSRLIF
jgi:hypothetical protein